DRVLERQEDALRRSLGRVQRQQVLAPPGRRAVRRLIARPSAERVAQRRLAGPVRPHDGVHLAGRDIQRQALEDRLVSDGDVEVGDGEHGQSIIMEAWKSNFAEWPPGVVKVAEARSKSSLGPAFMTSSSRTYRAGSPSG